MVFSNSVFLFVFLPLVMLGYYLIRQELRNYWILAVSILFYAWDEPSFTIIISTSSPPGNNDSIQFLIYADEL